MNQETRSIGRGALFLLSLGVNSPIVCTTIKQPKHVSLGAVGSMCTIEANSIHQAIMVTLVPFALLQVTPILSVHGCESRLSIFENSCISRTAVYEASVRANCSTSKGKPCLRRITVGRTV